MQQDYHRARASQPQRRFDRRRELIDEAKRRVSIVDAWQALNLPGGPGASCKSPFREDRNPSFSIFEDGRRFKDFATGDTGDVVCFIERATGCTRGEAIRKLFELAGIEDAPARQRRTKARKWPTFRRGTRAEKRALAGSRNLGPEAIDLAAAAGFLWFADTEDKGEAVAVWIVTDSTRRNAQARRLDGKGWRCLDGAKAKTLPGSRAAWAIGAADIGKKPFVVIIEGGADYLTAFHFMYVEGRLEDVAPVAMLGAGMKIPGDALPFFKNKRIRIFPHTDEQGQAAGRRWALQFHRAGAGPIDFFNFAGLIQTGGEPVCDLNNLTNQDCDNLDANFEVKEILPWNE